MTGLLVAGLACTLSAFTNVKKAPVKTNILNRTVGFDYLVQRTADQFTQVDPSDPAAIPDPEFCAASSERRCIYRVTTSGKTNIPSLTTLLQSYYTSAQIDVYIASGWLTAYSQGGNSIYWD
ncbi:hypothetical protein LPB86_08065 [Pedobacter sp. MC2016-14]|uniref:hypothetical protein n=1 Tax=Pedobacter sp. MC2016-14 TaxID=2897327 RepID=UPI001E2C4A40|nr:hypothetical protein [Pedobacter sp. MC2016-14]MCD0488181.1 hypothetical protein [Pedobacter sp. MC2016-14]